LTETDTISGGSQDKAVDLNLWLEVPLCHLMDAVHDERLPGGAIEPRTVVVGFGYTHQDHSSDGHLRDEIVSLIVAQLIQTSSHADVVSHLDEATGFGDVGNVPNRHLSLLEGKTSAILECLVPVVAVLLALLVESQEFTACALRLHQFPQVVRKD